MTWNVYKRWFISGFTGIGNAFENFENFSDGKSVTTLGTGFRYLVARKLGTSMGWILVLARMILHFISFLELPGLGNEGLNPPKS